MELFRFLWCFSTLLCVFALDQAVFRPLHLLQNRTHFLEVVQNSTMDFNATTVPTTTADILANNLAMLLRTYSPNVFAPMTSSNDRLNDSSGAQADPNSGQNVDSGSDESSTSSPVTSPPGLIQLNGCLLTERTSWYNYDRSAAAIDMALQYANDQILNPIGMNLVLTYRDLGTTCTEKNHAVSYAMSLIYEGVHCDAYIGAGCAYNYQSLYDLAAYLKLPFIGLPASGVGADADVSLYDNMARLSITHLNTVRTIMNFMKRFNYTSPTVIEDQDISINQQISMIMESTFQAKNPALSQATDFIEISSTTLTTDNITANLKEAMGVSRAIVLLTNASTTRQYMLVASSLGMTKGDYVFIAVELFPSTSWGTFTWKNNDPYDEIAKEAYRTLLVVSLTANINAAYDVFEKEVKKKSAIRATHNFTYLPNDNVDLVTAHFYDSVVFYASIMKDIYLNGSDIFLVDNFINVTAGYSFDSPVQGTVKLDVNGDRISAYQIKSLNTKSGLFEPAFAVSPTDPTVVRLGSLNWPNRADLPPNAPYCGYDGLNLRCAPKPLSAGSVAAAALIPTIVVLAGIAAVYWVIRKFIHKNQDPFWWRVFSNELIGVSVMNSASRSSQLTSTAGSRFQSKSQKSVSEEEKKKAEDEAETLETTVRLAFVLYGKTASFRDVTVALRELPLPLQRVTSATNNDLAALRTVKHYNLQEFYGISINDENLCEFVLGEVCQKGSLMALLEKITMTLDWQFKHSIMKGVVAGMAYLHTTKVQTHGDLSAHTILIDSRFVIKISDYGLSYFRPMEDSIPPDDDDEDRDFTKLLWRAPELLRKPILGGTQKGDMYSFAIVLQQIILRSAPFENSIESQRADYASHAKDLVLEVKRGANPPQRPVVPVSSCPGPIRELLEMCWDEHPMLRITFARVRELLQKALGKSGENIIEHLINRMDTYATELEHEAEEKMRMVIAEKERSEELLKGMLPKTISDRLRRGDMVYPEIFENTTVQFSDIAGFSEVLDAAPTPFVTINIMNTLYGACDHVIEGFDVYKVETVADNYMLVSGLPVRNGVRHVGEMAGLALILRRDIAALTFPSSPDVKLKLRAGMNSGPCVASVVGRKIPRYCLFGDTVNTASRMESQGEAGKIHISPSTNMLLERAGEFFTSPRGEINVKGKGLMETFWLIAKTSV